LNRRVREVVGTTIDDPEICVAEATKLTNYAFLKHNKYSGENAGIPGRFDIIVDNNPTSPCCCMRHLATLFDFYVDKLRPNGMVVTDREGLEWIPVGAPGCWSFDFEDLATASAVAGLHTFRVTRNVYVLTFTTPPRPTAPSLLRHVGRRARSLPMQVLSNSPRAFVRISRRVARAVLLATVPWALPRRFQAQPRTDDRTETAP
jgi:hypothetical protein